MPKKCTYNLDCYRLNPAHYKKYLHDHYGTNYQARLEALNNIFVKNNDPDLATINDEWFKASHLYWRFMGFSTKQEQLGFYQFILEKIEEGSLSRGEVTILIQLLHTMEEDNIREFGPGPKQEPLSNIWVIDQLRIYRTTRNLDEKEDEKEDEDEDEKEDEDEEEKEEEEEEEEEEEDEEEDEEERTI